MSCLGADLESQSDVGAESMRKVCEKDRNSISVLAILDIKPHVLRH